MLCVRYYKVVSYVNPVKTWERVLLRHKRVPLVKFESVTPQSEAKHSTAALLARQYMEFFANKLYSSLTSMALAEVTKVNEKSTVNKSAAGMQHTPPRIFSMVLTSI